MEAERVSASTRIEAAPEAVFAVLADPSAHADIDGTRWVRESLDGDRITAAGQVFPDGDVPPNHPDKDYKLANQVEVFDEPRTIAWKPGTESPETGELSVGGWIWRDDLEATGPSRTTVRPTYDWSAVPPAAPTIPLSLLHPPRQRPQQRRPHRQAVRSHRRLPRP